MKPSAISSIVAILLLVLLPTHAISAQTAPRLSEEEATSEELVASLLVQAFADEEYGEAIRHADQLIAIDSTNFVAYTAKGQSLGNLGNVDQGILALNRAIELNPAFAPAYLQRALLHYRARDYEQAAYDMDIAIVADPDDTRLRVMQAWYRVSAGFYAQAIDQYNVLLNEDPTLYDAYIGRAEALHRIGDTERALDDTYAAAELDPDNATAYAVQGDINLRAGRYAEALAAVEEAIRIQPEDATRTQAWLNYNNRGFCRFMLGDVEGAMKDIQLAMEYVPGNAFVYRNRALVYLEKGQPKRACADLQQADQLSSGVEPDAHYGPSVRDLLTQHCK